MFLLSDHQKGPAEPPPGPVQEETAPSCSDTAGRPERQRGETQTVCQSLVR